MSLPSMPQRARRFSIPASSFGIVLGMAGLSNCWRYAESLWGTDARISELLSALTIAICGALLFGYVMTWVRERDVALTEFRHPVNCCFIGLIPVSILLVGVLTLAWSDVVGCGLVLAGTAGQLAFSTYRSGGLLRGGRKKEETTPVMYLPTVAGNFVSAIALCKVGYIDAGKLFFGAGVLSWLALESVITHRLYTAEPLPLAIRPTLGVQLAPPAVASVAYLAVSGDSIDLCFIALLGYALLQLLLIVRLCRWFAEVTFGPAYWSFSFGATALVLATMHSAQHHSHPAIDMLALPLFVTLNIALFVLAAATLRLLFLNSLFMK